MQPYFIGSGMTVHTGERAAPTPATIHAQTGAALAASVRAAAVDFEGSSQSELARLVVVASGWTSSAFDRAVMEPLRTVGSATLAELLAAAARAAGDGTIHLFARWLPDGDLVADLAGRGVTLVAHPLESIERAALITGGRASAPLPARAA